MKQNPLAIVCIFFCLGIWTARYVHIPLFFIYIACVLFLAAALVSLDKQPLFSLCLGIAVFLGGFLHLSNAQTYPANHVSNFASDEGQKVYLIGQVVSNPEISRTFYGSQKTVFTFRVEDLKLEIASVAPSGLPRNDVEGWQAVEGLIKATLYGERRDKEGKRRVQYGDELVLQGSFERPPGLRNPGGFNYRAYLTNHNIFGLLKVKEKDAFLALGHTVPIENGAVSRTKWTTSLFRLKQKLHNIVYQYLKPEQAALLSAILLGERANLSQDIKDPFINTGTIHILAISGLHVGLITLILIACLRFLRLGRKLTFILTILLLIGYSVLSGMRPSVVRATIMAVLVLFGFLINREVKIYNSLGLAALVILIFNPRYLFDSGFQLSFLSVISIVYFAPEIEKLFPVTRSFLFCLARAFSVSLAACLGIAPLSAYYFNIVTPVAILANLLIVPCLFLVVSAGICFLIFAYFWPPLGAILGETSWFTLFGLTKLATLIAKAPLGFFRCPKPGILFFCGYYALILLIFNYKRLKLSSARLWIILALVANFLAWRPVFRASSGELTVSFLDVGHGDAIFIELPYSAGTMLIDGGPAQESDAGRWVILPFLWNKGINKVDAVVLTHPDNDHVGGLASVLKNIRVNYVFDNGMSKESISYNSYKAGVQDKVPYYRVIKQGEQILGFPQVELLVIHPTRIILSGREADANNNSIVLKLVYKDVGFLFCGDIQEEGIKQLLFYQPMLKSTVFKVPHHGSYEGRIEDYLFGVVSPEFAVISVERDQRFGFPAREVIEGLESVGTKVYNTSDNGAVIISTDGQDLRVETMVGAEAGI